MPADIQKIPVNTKFNHFRGEFVYSFKQPKQPKQPMQRHTATDAKDDSFDSLIAAALRDYAQKQAEFQRQIRAFSRWDFNDKGNMLSLTGHAGPPLVLHATPVGTDMPGVEQWAWAWANKRFGEPSREESARLKSLTGTTGYSIFEVPFFNAPVQDVDQLCALALQELDGMAIFKVKDQEPWCYYVVR